MDYIRNVDKVKPLLATVGNTVVATDEVYMIFPSRYLAIDIAYIGEEISTYGVVAIVDAKGNYGVLNINTVISTIPDYIESILINDIEHKKFHYSKGSVFIKNTKVVMKSSASLKAFDEFILKGKIPFYMDYVGLGTWLDNVKKHGGNALGDNATVIELLVSIISRDDKDPKIPFRLSKKKKPYFVDLQNIYYSVHGVVDKLSGSYFKEGLISALTNDAENLTQVEQILRA